jgi:thiamine pyrophosphate-dependent acetolactate synthase large subunit-like protein
MRTVDRGWPRFDDRVTGKLSVARGAGHSRDIDPTSIKKTFHAHIPIVGDAKGTADERSVGLGWECVGVKALRAPWLKQIDD